MDEFEDSTEYSNIENDMILNDLELSQKKIEFLQGYIKELIDFSVNCVCNQNKPLIKIIESLESQYNQLFKQLIFNERHQNIEEFFDSNEFEVKSESDSADNYSTGPGIDGMDVIEV